MNWDYFLFDLDNSLLYIPKPAEYFDKVLSETIKKLSRENVPSREERNKFWLSGSDYVKLLRNWEVRDQELFWSHFDEIDFNLRKKYIAREKIHLYDDVVNVLKNLKEKSNKKLAIVSNTADYIVDYVLEEFNLNPFFEVVFGLGSEKTQDMAKPSPEGINFVLNTLSYTNGNKKAIMIGDSIVDVFAAKRANIDACLLTRNLNKYPEGYDKWEYKPDFVIKNLDEIILI
jgi:phosphoglycolate phosphatase-like HAD superfamily hydrolase